MPAFLLQFDLDGLSRRLSRVLGCPMSPEQVRGLLRDAGFVETHRGWIGNDLRPLILAYIPPSGALFGL